MTGENLFKTVSALVAAGGLVFGIVKYLQVQEIEAARPYLEKKLHWCEAAVETASAIANGTEDEAKIRRFWELYWGVMGLIEKEAITRAMIDFGDALRQGQPLRERSLAIAHACRSELANDWSSSWSRSR